MRGEQSSWALGPPSFGKATERKKKEKKRYRQPNATPWDLSSSASTASFWNRANSPQSWLSMARLETPSAVWLHSRYLLFSCFYFGNRLPSIPDSSLFLHPANQPLCLSLHIRFCPSSKMLCLSLCVMGIARNSEDLLYGRHWRSEIEVPRTWVLWQYHVNVVNTTAHVDRTPDFSYSAVKHTAWPVKTWEEKQGHHPTITPGSTELLPWNKNRRKLGALENPPIPRGIIAHIMNLFPFSCCCCCCAVF